MTTALAFAFTILAIYIDGGDSVFAADRHVMPGDSKAMAGHGQADMPQRMKEPAKPGMSHGMKEQAMPGMPQGMKEHTMPGMSQGMKGRTMPGMSQGMKEHAQPGMPQGMQKQEPHDMSKMGQHDMTKMGKSVNVHVVHMAGVSRTVTQHIVTEFLLAALGVNTEEKFRSILEGRQRCRKILKALRDGDKQLALHGTKIPEILLHLAQVDELWARFDAVISDSVEAEKISREQVKDIADLSKPLLEAMGEMVSTFEAHADGGQLFSALSQTVGVAQKQNLLLHRMNELYLLIAYGHEVKRNQSRLAESIAAFDLALKALLHGNAELHVLPAPNAAIRLQYNAIGLMWKKHQPSFMTAVNTDRIAPETIRRAARRSGRMAAEMDKAVVFYHQL